MAQAQAMDVDQPNGGETNQEVEVRARERMELEALVDEELKKDVGSNPTGLYELVGVVSHKGASADGGAALFRWVQASLWLIVFTGHYIGWSVTSSVRFIQADAVQQGQSGCCRTIEPIQLGKGR
jgi:hypothetical protein